MFKKAERKRAKLRLGLAGTSGSGKTWSALEIATGMGGSIAMIDTEAGRGELYGNDFNYETVQLSAPYSPQRYIECIKCAESMGFDILIIDSLSHAWVGEGGVLDIVTQAGGQFQQGWNKGTPAQNSLVNAIITSKLHIIFTMRSKSEYVIETVTNKKGQSVQAPRKVGMAPVQRDGLEYECTVYIEMSQDHVGHFTKDNTKLFDQDYIQPTKETGKKLIEWLNDGKSFEDAEKEKIAEITFSLNNHKHAISMCDSIEDLKSAFTTAIKEFKGNDAAIVELTTVKDLMKEGLTVIARGENKSGPDHNEELREAA